MPIEGDSTSAEEKRAALSENSGNNRGRRRRQQAMESMNEETLDSLDQVFEAKLNAVRVYEQRLARVADPYARQTLQNMIQQERSQLLNLAELMELVEQTPDMNGFTRARRQMAHRLKSGKGKNITYGLGLVLLGALLLPGVKDTLKPLTAKMLAGINDLSEQAQGLIGSVREDMEDLVAEAQFERLKQSIDSVVTEDDLHPGGPAQ